ncbi:hypothetical protein F511_19925 [Dorcoceras hygrometricum]|uniref:Uncharacterized protein n=1 Tax=Dorcoceras hygrometricum TaxID=472368 RepID=A0A2Z7DFD1_9LAMI|nr:hypothetical protein F511_19925 [Dorcoceras hygrometricum]
MWELTTPLTVANSPSREMRDGSYPRASTSTLARSNQQAGYGYKRSDNNMEHMRTREGICLRAPHQLQANVQKQYPNEASQQEESNATTLTSIGAVYRRKSKKIRQTLNLELSVPPLLFTKIRRRRRPPCAAAARHRRKIVSGHFDEENPFVLISSVLLVQADEGVSFLVMDRIGDIYRNLPRRADVIVTTVGARHKCQQAGGGSGVMGRWRSDGRCLVAATHARGGARWRTGWVTTCAWPRACAKLDGTLPTLVGWTQRTRCAAMLHAGSDAARRRTANVAFDAACVRPLPHAIFVWRLPAGRRSGEPPTMS